tara:strand:- start:2599 stop:2730 length:132 start_codon:yes stop_codon:yes gene_type:complete
VAWFAINLLIDIITEAIAFIIDYSFKNGKRFFSFIASKIKKIF